MSIVLDNRLSCAASFVRDGAFLADIGSDHAYLPIHLYLNGRIAGALVSDVNEGPVSRARENIAQYGLIDKFIVRCADGLDGAEKYDMDDIAILGMGGELIVSIIDRAKWTRNSKYRLILQPMSRVEILYRYLCESGFEIVDERIVPVDRTAGESRLYRVICTEYSSKITECDDCEALIGKKNIMRMDEITVKYIKHSIEVQRVRLEGKNKAGQSSEYEYSLICKLNGLLSGSDKFN